MFGHGKAGRGRRDLKGAARRGVKRLGSAGHGRAGKARLGVVGLVAAGCGKVRQAWLAWLGRHDEIRLGEVRTRSGEAGTVGRASVWHILGEGGARQARRGQLGWVGHGVARGGMAGVT